MALVVSVECQPKSCSLETSRQKSFTDLYDSLRQTGMNYNRSCHKGPDSITRGPCIEMVLKFDMMFRIILLSHLNLHVFVMFTLWTHVDYHFTFYLIFVFKSRRDALSPLQVPGSRQCSYSDVIMGATVSQITSLTTVYSTVLSGVDKKKHQSSASLAYVRGIHRWPVNSPHKWPVTRKMFPFDDVIIYSHFVGYQLFLILLSINGRPDRTRYWSIFTVPCCQRIPIYVTTTSI